MISRWMKVLNMTVNWRQFSDMATVRTWIKMHPGMSDADIEAGTQLSRLRVDHALHALRFLDFVAVYRVSEHRRVYYAVGRSA